MRQQTLQEARLRLTARADPDDRLAICLAQDLAMTVRIGRVRDCHLASENAWLDRMGEQEIHEVAAMNTSIELVSGELRVHEIDEQTWTLSADSYSTATIITMLDEHVPVPTGRRLNLERGVLVAVPTARTVIFGALDGPGSYRRNCQTMIRRCIRDRVEPDFLSTSVYLVSDDAFGRVAYPEWPEGRFTIMLAAPGWLRRAVEEGEL